MSTWVLIVAITINGWGKYEAATLTSVPGFASLEECKLAGAATTQLPAGNTQTAKFICVEQNRKPQ